jgi:hypothetical protein
MSDVTPPRDPRPVWEPVKFNDQDTQRATELLQAAVPAACAAVPELTAADVDRITALARGANVLIGSGRAARGAAMVDLAVAARYARDSHIRPVFPSLGLVAQIVSRLMMARYMPVNVEHILAQPTEVRRETNLLGLDHTPGCAWVEPVIQHELGGLDRQLEADQLPFLYTTLADPARADANPAEVRRAAKTFDCPVPDSPAAWIELLMHKRAEAFEAIYSLAVNHPELLGRLGIDARAALTSGFSNLLVLETQPHGFPRERGKPSLGTIFPGKEPEMIAAAERAGMIGIACCGEVTDPRVLRGGRNVVPDGMGMVTRFAVVPEGSAFTARGQYLLHTATRRTGSRTRMWRVFGMEPDDPRALGIAQRDSQPFIRACRKRIEKDRPTGIVYPKRPKNRMGMWSLLRIADNTRVCAEKERKSRLR